MLIRIRGSIIMIMMTIKTDDKANIINGRIRSFVFKCHLEDKEISIER